MKASFVDLRQKTREILGALRRNERVTLFYRGRPAAVIAPIGGGPERPIRSAANHAAFGLWAERDDAADVAALVRRWRQGRRSAL